MLGLIVAGFSLASLGALIGPVQQGEADGFRTPTGTTASSLPVIMPASAPPSVTDALPSQLASPQFDEPALIANLEQAVFQSLTPRQQEMIDRGFSRLAKAGLVTSCFAPDTPYETVEAFRRGIPGFGQRFNAATRWGPTATDVDGGNQGEPTIVTWSFVPDGTILPNEFGEGDLPSELFAWMNSVYPGGFNDWKPLFDNIFGRWSQVSGLVFVYQSTDDGAPFPDTPGALGIRGDVRVSAKNIDGNSGILAYNYFPDLGDMVINSFDSFYNNTGNNSLGLRNVLAHEVGHGIGLAHVCPVQQNKLMEPFVSTAYDGVRHDDIRAAQFNYGDTFEPNNTLAASSPLGTISATTVTVGSVAAPAVQNASSAGLSNGSDQDWYSLSLSNAGVLSIDLISLGFSYDDAPQDGAPCPYTGSCCFNDFTDSGATPLSVELTTSTGTPIALLSNLTEGTAMLRQQLNAGSYRLRVFTTAGVNDAQLYQLRLMSQTQTLVVEASPAPELLSPSNPTLTTTVRAGSQTVNASQVRLFYRFGSVGAFASVAMSSGPGANQFGAAIPSAPCPTLVQYYYQATSTQGTITRLPSDAPTSFFATNIGVLQVAFTDDFETDKGWVVGPNTASSGIWLRDDPIGTFAQPEDDTTPAGSLCFFTGQSGAFGEAAGTNDVDGGLTRLTSPAINLAGRFGVRVSYNRWYNNVAGGAAGQDTFRAQVSIDNGSNWIDAQLIGPGPTDLPELQSGWRGATWTLPAGVTPSAQTRIRFIADDAGAGTVVEAGIDDLRVTALGCGPVCDSIDFNNDSASFDPTDIDALLSVFSEGPCIPAQATCSDIDFNNDGSLFDPCDIDSFLLVFSEGPCTPCGQ